MPSPPTDTQRYGRVAMALHWLLALMITASFSLGLYMADLPFTVQRLRLYNWHKWAGVAILALSAFRLLWRLAHRPPPLGARIEAAMPRWQRAVHHATLCAMYILFFGVPLAGWAYTSARGYPVVWFGVLALPDFVPRDPVWADALLPVHRYGAYGLAGLVLLHVAAVAKHHWIDRDGLAGRMFPSPRKKVMK